MSAVPEVLVSPHAAKVQKSWKLGADLTLEAVLTHGDGVELSLTYKFRRLSHAYAPREKFSTSSFRVRKDEVRISIDLRGGSHFEMPEVVGLEVCQLTGIEPPEAKQS